MVKRLTGASHALTGLFAFGFKSHCNWVAFQIFVVSPKKKVSFVASFFTGIPRKMVFLPRY